MLQGKLPYQGRTQQELIANIVNQQNLEMKGVSQQCDVLIRAMLSNHRPSAKQIFLSSWFKHMMHKHNLPNPYASAPVPSALKQSAVYGKPLDHHNPPKSKSDVKGTQPINITEPHKVELIKPINPAPKQ